MSSESVTQSTSTPSTGPAKYLFARALRPFSLSVALITCGLGITLAWKAGLGDSARAWMVMLSGILLQSAVNLFNDHADLVLWQNRNDNYGRAVVAMIWRNTRIAVAMTAAAMIMGGVLVYQTGWPLLLLGIVGMAGGYFYTGEPLAYKNRGLGVVAVFLFTGVMMVAGSYLAVAGSWSWQVCLLAVPVSLISCALLLANELRDVDDDINNGIGTFTVRVGFSLSKVVYLALLAGVGLGSLVLAASGDLSAPWWLLPSLLVIKAPVMLLTRTRTEKQRRELVALPPLTGRFFMVYGLGFMLAL